MNVTPPTPMETLPCGCQMGDKDGIFYYRPCSLLCEYYLYVLKQTAADSKPVITRIEE